jgi:hypothetical protein
MAFWEVTGTVVTEDNNAVTFRTFVPAEELVDTVNEGLDAIFEIENPEVYDEPETMTNGCFAMAQGLAAIEPPAVNVHVEVHV